MDQEQQPGDHGGVRERFPALYSQLRDVAGRVLARRASPSLAPSDLLHEAFVKLQAEEKRREAADRSVLGEKPDATFKACFGAACRDVLVDRVRRRTAQKRGEGKGHEELRSTIMVPGRGDTDALVAHDAIEQLAELDAELARLVEARVFGELSVPECAKLFGLSPRTIDRRWAFAAAWLRDRLK